MEEGAGKLVEMQGNGQFVPGGVLIRGSVAAV
jgi:hypothetical protein